MEVAFTGIDGSGKTTFIKSVGNLLRERGIEIAIIDVPYFLEVPGLYKLGFLIKRLWEWSDKRENKLIIVCLAVFSALLYFLARWKVRRAEVVLVERHPRIELLAYATLYAGTRGAWLVKRVRSWWSQPDMAVFLSVSPEAAHERILSRGQPLQSHETLNQLKILDFLLSQAVQKVACHHFIETDGVHPEILAIQYLMLFLEKIPESMNRPSP